MPWRIRTPDQQAAPQQETIPQGEGYSVDSQGRLTEIEIGGGGDQPATQASGNNSRQRGGQWRIRTPQQQAPRTGADEFGRHFSGSVADVFGAPASLFNMGWQGVENLISPLMGREPADVGIPLEGADIRQAMSEHGDILPGVSQGDMPLAGEEPQSMAGRTGEMAGLAAGMMVPLAGATSRVQPGAQTMRNIPRNLAADIGQQFVRRPTTSAVAETGLGALSGAGGYAAEQSFPDNPNARMIGEMSPLAPLMLPTAIQKGMQGTRYLGERLPLAGPAIRGADALKEGAQKVGRTAYESRSPRGALDRARARIGRATDDPTEAAQQLQRAETVSDTDPLPYGRMNTDERMAAEAEQADLLEGFTPAQRTGETGLMDLEVSSAERAGTLRQRDEQLADVNANIRQAGREFGGPEATEATRQTFEQAQTELTRRLADRVKQAEQRAQAAQQRLGPNASQEQANRVARDEIESALAAARQTERQLYSQIPENTAAPYTKTEQTFQQILNDTGTAQRNDIPPIARRMLDNNSDSYIGAQGQQTTIKELRSLQSKLREQARLARSNSQWNRARIADDIATAINDDLANAAAGPQASQDIKNAVAFSRQLNDEFSKGTVGKLLGRTKAGGDAVPEGMTLEASLGVRGPKARESYDEIVAAANTPALQGAVEDYVKNRFVRDAVRDGKIDSTKAKNFMRGHADLLERNPTLQKQLQDAIDANDTATLYQRQADSIGKKMGNPRVSKAELFIQKDSQKAFDDLRNSRNPGQEAQKLVNMTRRDTTGEAEKGLKAGLMDYIMSRSGAGAADAADQTFISGRKMRELMETPAMRDIASRVLTADERRRLDRMVRSAERLDLARRARPSQEGVIGDAPGSAMLLLGRLTGAGFGRWLAGITSGGNVQTPGIISAKVKELMERGVKDPAANLITDAMQDEKLLQALLLQPQRANQQQMRRAGQRLNAWLTATMIENGLDPDNVSEADTESGETPPETEQVVTEAETDEPVYNQQ